MANYIIGAVLIVIIALAIRHVRKNKGACECGCSCEECHTGICSTDKK